MRTIKVRSTHLTKEEAAKILGLQVYDVALPQPWLDSLIADLKASPDGRLGKLPENIYHIILSGLVWCYDKPYHIFGGPVALTTEVLQLLNHECVREVWNFSNQDAVIELDKKRCQQSGMCPVTAGCPDNGDCASFMLPEREGIMLRPKEPAFPVKVKPEES